MKKTKLKKRRKNKLSTESEVCSYFDLILNKLKQEKIISSYTIYTIYGVTPNTKK